MKKLLSFFSVLSLVTISTANIVACSSNESSSAAQNKQKFTTETLDKFFSSHMAWDFKDQFFFKNKSEQTDEENDRFSFFSRGLMTDNLFTLIKNKFDNLFEYNQKDYWFSILFQNDKIFDKSGIIVNNLYKIPFDVVVTPKDESWSYRKDNLILNFEETKMYSKQVWLEKFIKHYTENSIERKTPVTNLHNFNQLFLMSIMESTSNLNKYKENNSTYVMEHVSEELTNLFSGEKDFPDTLWLYEDYKINFNIKNYQYLSDDLDMPYVIYFNSDFTASFLNEPEINFSANSNFSVLFD
ncbi:lipoprotein [Spiroplasma sp. DGKH1]|uniref:lipoprotein n=1 Tax=Spiroplasma sp. DGKH1 TaxID=3050074 RepID=UPI0034C69513